LTGTRYAAGGANDGRDGDAQFADIDDGAAAAALEYPRIEEEEEEEEEVAAVAAVGRCWP